MIYLDREKGNGELCTTVRYTQTEKESGTGVERSWRENLLGTSEKRGTENGKRETGNGKREKALRPRVGVRMLKQFGRREGVANEKPVRNALARSGSERSQSWGKGKRVSVDREVDATTKYGM